MMTDEEFLRIAGHMKQRYGIDLSQKKVIMNGRLENHIKSGGWSSFHAFMNDLEKDSSGRLEKELVNLLTTNHTYFMREFEHFQFFKSVVLPELKQKAQSTKDLRIWCGAASTGEEPYMIAMVLKDFFGLESSSW
ncbi:MAG: chemotaxis protein CheR, partial [Acetatifactor sp.]|nr:chemotaxis protein CheR [Acetatifactor sp.]